jgi:hypothetical protein
MTTLSVRQPRGTPTERFPRCAGPISHRQITAQPVRPRILDCKPALNLLSSSLGWQATTNGVDDKPCGLL